MPPGLTVGLLAAVYIVRLIIARERQKKGAPRTVLHLRTIVWLFLTVFWVVTMFFGLVQLTATIEYVARGTEKLGETGLSVTVFVVTQTLGLTFLLSHVWIERIAARGSYKLAYYASHFALTLPDTVEPYGAACFFAYFALARRGNVTRDELAWVGARLDKEKRALGLFGASFGLSLALESKLALRDGDREKARDLRERARVVFGTVTYLTNAACPKVARRLTNDYLALDAATRGEWGSVEALSQADATPTSVAIRKWVRENLAKRPEPKSRAARKAVKLPIYAKLAARQNVAIVASSDAAFDRMKASYAALTSGEILGPRSILNLLLSLDRFVDPRSPDCRLPTEVKSDDEAAGAVADEIASAIILAVKDRGLPVFALASQGAVTARVHRALETTMPQELDTALKSGRRRGEQRLRGSPRDEWMEVSRIRGLYRRLEYTLGTPAANAFSQQLFFEYGKLGVLLSESAPRRRPLAHAVFNCLHREASRFGVTEAEARERRNMRVTSRID